MKNYLPLLALALAIGPTTAMAADNCTINIQSNDAMQFDLKSATVSASCKAITINLKHTGKLPAAAMGHNVVISKSADMAGIAKDAIKAGAKGGYLPTGDARILGHTELIGGGGSTTAKFPGNVLSAGQDYTFFCSFPGHSTIMKGKLIVSN